MIDGVHKLKKDSALPNGMEFKKGQEFELVGGVLYISGFPIQFNMQATIISWMDKNQDLFKDDTRNF